MSPSTHYGINGARVIHEEFDREVVIVNLDTGRYYCLQHSGADVWRWLVDGHTAADVAAALALCYDVAPAAASEATDRLIESLVSEQLLVPRATPSSAPPVPSVTTRQPFVVPVLQSYTDMQDLLLLDPIHETDPAGWPVAKADHRAD